MTCTKYTPPWFTGHWRDWHRGHGCERDDGKERSVDAKIELLVGGFPRYGNKGGEGLLPKKAAR